MSAEVPVEEGGQEEPGVWDAHALADRVGELAGDLFRSFEPVDDHLVRAEGIPELLGQALGLMRDPVDLTKLMAITVVDRTDLGEGLDIVHHLSRHDGGALLEIRTPYRPDEEGHLPTPPSATQLWRAAAWQEREAWELHGVPFDGHGGLTRLLLPRWWSGHPLRRDAARQLTASPEGAVTTPGEDPFEGEGWLDVALPHGPMGGRLRLTVREREGRVTKAHVRVGHLHRGVEGLCEERTYQGVLPLAARAAARSSVHWQVAYAEAVERLGGVEVPPRGRAVRVALMELERIADHMLAHASVLDILGCRAAAATVWSDRELVMDAAQVVTGQRLVQDAVAIGGGAGDAPGRWDGRLRDVARTVQAAVHRYVREAEALSPFTRLEGLARVHLEDMRGWGLTGPLLRAAGVPRDARSQGRCASYAGLGVPVVTREEGDAMARSEVRLLEMAASAKVLEHLARTMPGGRVRARPTEEVPKGMALGVVEDPRGELVCLVVSDGTERPRRVRWRSPDFAHAAALADLLIDSPATDVALAVASVDICVGGVDR